MKIENLSVRQFLKVIGLGFTMTALLLILIMYLVTWDSQVAVSGLVLTAAFYVWGGVFLYFFQKKLVCFTDSLCRTLDGMMDGSELPGGGYEAETLMARISHRMERLYRTMRENRRKLEEEKAELQSLVSDISHQTKTPIANLKMINDTLLTRSVNQEKQREFLQATASQLDKLDFLIQVMVKTSRLETGVITLDKKAAPMAETLAAAINGILTLIERRQIHFNVDCPEGLTVAHDCRWTSEALFNLLENAVKYTPVGGSVCVSVQAWEMYVKIDVADSGRGIPESAQAAIFKRFYREEDVHEEDGVGIGLYLAREIVSMQGGYIRVASEVDKGSVFSVFLPVR